MKERSRKVPTKAPGEFLFLLEPFLLFLKRPIFSTALIEKPKEEANHEESHFDIRSQLGFIGYFWLRCLQLDHWNFSAGMTAQHLKRTGHGYGYHYLPFWSYAFCSFSGRLFKVFKK